MLPESKLIKSEMYLRHLVLTNEVMQTQNSLIRWIGLSLGLVNKKESRLGILKVFEAIAFFQFVKKSDPSVDEIMEYIKSNYGNSTSGEEKEVHEYGAETLSEKAVRYHLLQLKEMGLIENKRGFWFFSNEKRYNAEEWVEEYIKTNIESVLPNLKVALKELNAKMASKIK